MYRSAHFDHRLWTRVSILVDQVLLEASRIDSDPHRYSLVACPADDLLESLFAADISWVDSDLVNGWAARGRDGVDACERHPVVVVDVGDQRNLDPIANQLDGFDVLFLGHGHADNLAAGLFEPMNLGQRCLGVEGIGGGHRLDPDRLIAADNVLADTHLGEFYAASPSSHRPSFAVL